MKKIKTFLIFYFLMMSSLVWANPAFAPPNFVLENDKAIFTDFVSAEYNVIYDISNKKTYITSVIKFVNDEVGMPLFDLIDEPSTVVLDGETALQQLITTPHSETENDYTQLRIVKKNILPGPHTLVVTHELKAFPAIFNKNTVNSGFFMSDDDPRGLLERYLPANLEHDQVSMKLNIKIIGATTDETIFTNGNISELSKYHWSIEFPKYFNCSSLYFHIRAKDETSILQYSYGSSDQRLIPVTIYKDSKQNDDLDQFRSALDEKLNAYEHLFGQFPHSSITIFVSDIPDFAMEYAGVAVTDLDSLTHELIHSYFGRGVMPANGNAGWIDEAMATFVAGPYSPDANLIQPINMGAHSPYYRANDMLGYFFGLNFLGYLDQQFKKKNSLLSMNNFLTEWYKTHTGQVITVPMLEHDLEQYSGIDLTDLFLKYVYGIN